MTDDLMRDRMLAALSKQYADEGKLIEAGWFALQQLALPADAPPIQIREMRQAYMAGAQHLWASIMAVLDPEGDEPTPADLRRMDLIAKELDTWGKEVMAAAERGHW